MRRKREWALTSWNGKLIVVTESESAFFIEILFA
jgi:hypothetical protein